MPDGTASVKRCPLALQPGLWAPLRLRCPLVPVPTATPHGAWSPQDSRSWLSPVPGPRGSPMGPSTRPPRPEPLPRPAGGKFSGGKCRRLWAVPHRGSRTMSVSGFSDFSPVLVLRPGPGTDRASGQSRRRPRLSQRSSGLGGSPGGGGAVVSPRSAAASHPQGNDPLEVLPGGGSVLGSRKREL